MNFKIHSWDSVPPNINLETYEPQGAYCIGLEFTIRIEGLEAEESFTFMLCNLEGLVDHHNKLLNPETFYLEGFIIQERYSFPGLVKFLNNMIKDMSPQNYMDLILKLESKFGWEYSQEIRAKGKIDYVFDGEWY
ncbi:hypothetical protein C9994_00240 [Marivirga lumbricoides]|uniref:Uncharacterized protein n=1 Tax=Marivirga lumbricoides TaxID=1046115 RepID=A0A2T4DW46_9BACT|nr:hypothetical protein C9994_00240 [Marivirga lumbricoides]